MNKELTIDAMKEEFTLTYIIDKEESWWKGECKCGKTMHLPEKYRVKHALYSHLFLQHDEYAELGVQLNWQYQGEN